MATVSDIIFEAFLDLGLVAAGQAVTTEEQTDAFLRLNQMLRSWSNEHVSIFTESHTPYPLVAGTSAYTLGVGGSFVTAARPVKIFGCSATSGGFRVPVKVMGFEEFHSSVDDGRGIVAILPQAMARDNSFPLVNLKFFPTPAPAPGTVEIDYWTELTQFASPADTVNLPPGFEDALHYNLATRLYPQYARVANVDPMLAINAQLTKTSITALTASVLGMAPDPVDTQRVGNQGTQGSPQQ
jgi:hypothetical protein